MGDDRRIQFTTGVLCLHRLPETQQTEMPRKPSKRIDLGLAILSTRPRHPRTLEEIAAFCGCHNTAISRIERAALAKLRARLAVIRADLRP